MSINETHTYFAKTAPRDENLGAIRVGVAATPVVESLTSPEADSTL